MVLSNNKTRNYGLYYYNSQIRNTHITISMLIINNSSFSKIAANLELRTYRVNNCKIFWATGPTFWTEDSSFIAIWSCRANFTHKNILKWFFCTRHYSDLHASLLTCTWNTSGWSTCCSNNVSANKAFLLFSSGTCKIWSTASLNSSSFITPISLLGYCMSCCSSWCVLQPIKSYITYQSMHHNQSNHILHINLCITTIQIIYYISIYVLQLFKSYITYQST